MPDEIKEEILNEGAKRAINMTYKNVLRAFYVLSVAVLLAIGAVTVALWALHTQQITSCEQRQERTEVTRSLWNAVFDELEDMGSNDVTLDRLQERIETELPPVEC